MVSPNTMVSVVMFAAIPLSNGIDLLRFLDEQTYGWHYDLIFLVANLVILTTGGGRLVLI